MQDQTERSRAWVTARQHGDGPFAAGGAGDPTTTEATVDEASAEAGTDGPDDSGAWAALVVLVTATTLFFAAFALLYCLSSLFRAAPPTLGRASPTTTEPAGLTVTPASGSGATGP
jgi:hypothetical protein